MAQRAKLEHIPRYFFKEVKNGNLEKAAEYLANMIAAHLERYPSNEDMLTMFISSHLIFTLDLTGYLDVMEGIPIEPIIQREVRRYREDYAGQPDALLTLSRNILLSVDAFSLSNPFHAQGPVQQGKEGGVNQNGRIRAICSYVDKHYQNPNLTVTSLSERFDISVSYLSRVFHQATGFRLGEYIAMLRFHEANRLLSATEMPIAEIANACGFSSCSAFIRAYRAKEGMTPGARRKQFQLRQETKASS